MTKLRGLLSHHTNSDAVININACANRVLRIYQGHFLAREETTSWSVSLEERLRHRFIHTMLELGGFWEQQGVSAKAIEYYQKGIEVDDMVETFYQRLIVCLDQVGRQAEAIASYNQCRRVLSISLGLEPTDETQQIYHRMISTRQKQAG
jgi:two-component SAPR family response regulator